MTKLKDAPAALAPAPFVEGPDFFKNHLADKARRQAEIDANREEMLKCLNPDYAKSREDAKPQWKWTVEVKRLTAKPKRGVVYVLEKEQVVAQNENDAWAKFCDKVGDWPSRRDSKPKFTRGKQLPAGPGPNVADDVIPCVRRKPKDELEDAWVEV